MPSDLLQNTKIVTVKASVFELPIRRRGNRFWVDLTLPRGIKPGLVRFNAEFPGSPSPTG